MKQQLLQLANFLKHVTATAASKTNQMHWQYNTKRGAKETKYISKYSMKQGDVGLIKVTTRGKC